MIVRWCSDRIKTSIEASSRRSKRLTQRTRTWKKRRNGNGLVEMVQEKRKKWKWSCRNGSSPSRTCLWRTRALVTKHVKERLLVRHRRTNGPMQKNALVSFKTMTSYTSATLEVQQASILDSWRSIRWRPWKETPPKAWPCSFDSLFTSRIRPHVYFLVLLKNQKNRHVERFASTRCKFDVQKSRFYEEPKKWNRHVVLTHYLRGKMAYMSILGVFGYLIY